MFVLHAGDSPQARCVVTEISSRKKLTIFHLFMELHDGFTTSKSCRLRPLSLLGLSEEERLFKQLFTILTVLGILSTQLKGQSQSDRRRGPLPDFDIRESQRSTDQTGELRKAVLASFASSADQ